MPLQTITGGETYRSVLPPKAYILMRYIPTNSNGIRHGLDKAGVLAAHVRTGSWAMVVATSAEKKQLK